MALFNIGTNLRKRINHPRVQDAIKHAKRAGELD